LVGKNEQELTNENVPYEYGVARYSDLAKGMMQGDEVGGLLKILFHLETHKILGTLLFHSPLFLILFLFHPLSLP